MVFSSEHPGLSPGRGERARAEGTEREQSGSAAGTGSRDRRSRCLCRVVKEPTLADYDDEAIVSRKLRQANMGQSS